MEQPFVIEKTYHAPSAKVWNALTDKEQMNKWYFEIDSFKAEEGFEFEFYGQGTDGKKYLHKCKVLEVIPGKKIKHSWRYDGLPGNSFVTFELFADGDKTTLRLTHEGIESFAVNGPSFVKENFKMGWTELIGTLLKNFVEG